MSPSTRTRSCPKCYFDEDVTAPSCRKCGIVFAKYDAARDRFSAPPPADSRPGGSARSNSPPRSFNLGRVLFVTLIAAVAAWYFLSKPYQVVGPEPASGGPVVVFMHGFGAPGDDLVRAAKSIGSDSPQTSFVVVEAPHHKGLGRAWMVGGTLEQTTEQVAESRQRVNDTLDDLVEQGVAPENIYLGGFSQGSQMALDMAFGEGSAHPVGGLILLSGGYPSWPGAPSSTGVGASNLAPSARAIVAHGNSDRVISIGNGKQVHAMLRGRMSAEWVEFEGGHSVRPAESAIAQFLNAH